MVLSWLSEIQYVYNYGHIFVSNVRLVYLKIKLFKLSSFAIFWEISLISLIKVENFSLKENNFSDDHVSTQS